MRQIEILGLLVLFSLNTHATEYFADQAYGKEPQHTYDLCIGESSTLLILVHGGGWGRTENHSIILTANLQIQLRQDKLVFT